MVLEPEFVDVKGNRLVLVSEALFAICGEFGIRLEDCFYMTEDGPKLFTAQSPSIEQPFG